MLRTGRLDPEGSSFQWARVIDARRGRSARHRWLPARSGGRLAPAAGRSRGARRA